MNLINKSVFIMLFMICSVSLFGALGTPGIISPSGSSVYDSTPTFTWSPVSGATRYRLAVLYKSSSGYHDAYWFEVVVQGQSSVSYTATSSQQLLTTYDYKWTVRAESSSQTGSWAPAIYFKYKTLAKPAQSAPTASVLYDNAPTFSWSAVAGATRYRLAVMYRGTSGNHDQYWFEIVKQGQYATSYTPTYSQQLITGKDYKWTVRAENDSQVGQWNSGIYFIYSTLATPTYNSPLTSVVNNDRPTFSWGSVSGATKYRFKVLYKIGSSYSGVWIDEVRTGSTNTSYWPTYSQRLMENYDYKWTVAAENSSQSGSSGSGVIFAYEAAINLSKPVLQTPSGVIDDTTPYFNWYDVTDATSYTLQIYRNGSPLTPVTCGSSYYQYTSELDPNVNYSWKVKAHAGTSSSEWSNEQNFSISVPTPDYVTLDSNGTVIDTNTPSFRLQAGGTYNNPRFFKYINGEPEEIYDFQMRENNTVLKPDANLAENEVYLVTSGGTEYVVCYDTGHGQSHYNVVAENARPAGVNGNPSSSYDNRTAFIHTYNKLGTYGIYTMFIPKGRWAVSNDITLTKSSIKIKGCGESNTVLVAPTNSLTQSQWSYALFKSFSSSPTHGLEISNLTIRGLFDDMQNPPDVNPISTSYTYDNVGTALILYGNNMNIHNVTFRLVKYGVLIKGGDFNTIKTCKFQYTHKGIGMENSSKGTVDNNTIRWADTQGILVGAGCTYWRIIFNDISGAQHRGIHCGPLDGGLILKNTITNTPLGNCNISATGQPVNMTTGIIANGSNLIIAENTVSNAYFYEACRPGEPFYNSVGGNGIKLENGPSNIAVVFNNASSNETAGILVDGSNSGIVVAENTISNNGLWGIHVQSGAYQSKGRPFCTGNPPVGGTLAISNVYLLNNTISNSNAMAYPTSWVPSGYPNVTGTGCSNPGYTGVGYSSYPALRAEYSVHRDITVNQNPYYAQVNYNNNGLNDDISNVVIATADTSERIMLDQFSSNVKFHYPWSGKLTLPNLVKIDNQEQVDTSYPSNLTFAGPTEWTDSSNLLKALRDIWDDTDKLNGPTEVEQTYYNKFNSLITRVENGLPYTNEITKYSSNK